MLNLDEIRANRLLQQGIPADERERMTRMGILGLKADDRVLIVPEEAHGDASHPACVAGTVVKPTLDAAFVRTDADVEIRGWRFAPSKVVFPENIRIL